MDGNVVDLFPTGETARSTESHSGEAQIDPEVAAKMRALGQELPSEAPGQSIAVIAEAPTRKFDLKAVLTIAGVVGGIYIISKLIAAETPFEEFEEPIEGVEAEESLGKPPKVTKAKSKPSKSPLKKASRRS